MKYNKKHQINTALLEQVFENMKRYKAKTELQESAYAFIVNFLTSRDEK